MVDETGERTAQQQESEWLLSAVADLLAAITKGQPLLTSRPLDGIRQYAAAALVRGCDLIDAGLVALEAQRPEAVGVLARTGWECWLVGTFLLFGKEEAYFRMEAEQQRQERVLADRSQMNAASIVDERARILADAERRRRIAAGVMAPDDEQPVKFDRLSVEKMAEEAGRMIAAATGQPADVGTAYDIFYRSHSAYDTHGLRSIERYVHDTHAGYLAMKRSDPWIPPHRVLAIAAMYLSLLAGWIFDEFSIQRRDLNEIQDRLVKRAGAVGEQVAGDLRSWSAKLTGGVE